MNFPQQLKSDSHLPQAVKNENEKFELSVYSGDFPTKDDFKAATNRLSIAFPKMTKEFFLLLTEFAINEKFTAERLSDAVNHVIKNFQYKELNISDIIKFDKRIKLYSGEEFGIMQTKGYHASEFLIVRKNPIFWAMRKDLAENGVDEKVYEELNCHRKI